jgi:acyl-CoA reductase-like NAD-dependent aldehyde dehydrogenase
MSNKTSSYKMLIGGELVATAATMDVINPSTGKAFEKAPVASAADLDRAVAAAKAAFPKWRATTLEQRRKLVVRAADELAAHADELAPIFTSEHGRPVNAARDEILGAAYWMKALSQIEIPVEVTEDTPARRIEVHHEPLGVVCALVPWNFPVLLASWKIAHAALTGNVLVLKPSPFTPLTTLKIGEILRDVFPPGVFNVISGGDELGPMMTSHPGFAKISFTGSSATGKRIMESASHDLKRITLELGGNDAAIVMPDIDIDTVVPQLFIGAFLNTAQVCVATKRLYVHDKIYDAVRDKMHEMAKSHKVGDGAEKGTAFGPIQNRPQYLRVKGLLDDARRSGLKILEGGPVPDNDGYFIPLTLVDNPPENSRVVVEEAFGPILPLLRFSDIDDVIARANNTDYGLTSAVWSKDLDQAVAIAHRLESGTVWINENLQSSPTTPLGGHKKSGFGVENGLAGLMEFTQSKAIYIHKTAAA